MRTAARLTANAHKVALMPLNPVHTVRHQGPTPIYFQARARRRVHARAFTHARHPLHAAAASGGPSLAFCGYLDTQGFWDAAAQHCTRNSMRPWVGTPECNAAISFTMSPLGLMDKASDL